MRRMKVAYTVGSALWVAASLAFLAISPASPSFVYPLALVVGAANALILVSHAPLRSLAKMISQRHSALNKGTCLSFSLGWILVVVYVLVLVFL